MPLPFLGSNLEREGAFFMSSDDARTVLDRELQEFIIDRQAQGFTAGTVRYYSHTLQIFRGYASANGIDRAQDITPAHLRGFLVYLQNRGHNQGGCVHIYGALKTFLNWFELEYNPAGWENPLRRVKPPKRTSELMKPIDPDDFRKLVRVCNDRTEMGARDKMVFMVLLDSGIRRAELLALRIGDVNLETGEVLVRSGKGRKTRITIIGPKTRKAVARYLRFRPTAGDDDVLVVTNAHKPLTIGGLREVLRRASGRAGVPEPGVHEFRRAFALAFLRSGGDIERLRRLLGHNTLAVVGRYLAFTDADLKTAHGAHSPVENIMKK